MQPRSLRETVLCGSGGGVRLGVVRGGGGGRGEGRLKPTQPRSASTAAATAPGARMLEWAQANERGHHWRAEHWRGSPADRSNTAMDACQCWLPGGGVLGGERWHAEEERWQ